MRKAVLSPLLSLLVPGLGQIVNRQLFKGSLMVAAMSLLFLILLGFALHQFSVAVVAIQEAGAQPGDFAALSRQLREQGFLWLAGLGGCLALLWVYKVERKPGQSHVPVSEVWFRFPKFVIGYVFCWLSVLAIAQLWPAVTKAMLAGAGTVSGPMRSMFFALTFVAMGCISDFSKLKGMGRMALLYGVSLVFIIAPIAYLVAYVFHRGMMPPLAGS